MKPTATAKATVDKSLCVACGMCAGACPTVFRMGTDGRAEAFADIAMEFFDDAQDVAMDCPVGAIAIERTSATLNNADAL